ncbi:MAG: hypothetical protein GTO02_06715, partial [Candidatus Dadabacteria bacterium]|nr:hypothetical protein [Candidatus Dadabacteria bacterium]
NPTPKGFKYNVIRNPQTKPSVRKEEDLKAYKDRIEDDIQKQPKHYFHRIRIPISDEEIDRWESDWLQPIIRDMERWFLSDYTWPEYYRPNNLKTEYGTLSPWAPALAENDFSSYEKRKHLFEELVE